MPSTKPPTPELIGPDTPAYDQARAVFNLTADLHPAAVCVAANVADVQAVVRYAREHDLRVAPMTTGHIATALPDLGDTILLRPQLHHGEVVVDPVTRRAWVSAGARWQDVIVATAPHGLTAMHGSSPEIGVIGYLLGGGLSWYGRMHGLAANLVNAFEVVTADGKHLRVDADHQPDLYHALRGGGGNFAIVTSVEIELLPYAVVTAGNLYFLFDDAPSLLATWRDWAPDSPDAIMSMVRTMTLPALPTVPEPLRDVPIIRFDVTALQSNVADDLAQRLTAASAPIFGGLNQRPGAAIPWLSQDPETPVATITDGYLLERLDDATIDEFLTCVRPGSPLLAGELRQLGGSLASPPPCAGARGHLEGSYSMIMAGMPGLPAPTEELLNYFSHCLDALRPWATGTRYANFAEWNHTLDGCLPDDELDQLRKTKDKVNPDGLIVGAQALPERPNTPQP